MLIASCVSEAIKGLKRPSLAELQYCPHAWHPIRAFAVNQMSDNIEHAPGIFTFVSRCPRLRQITQEHIESRGRTSEDRYCVLQVMFHDYSAEYTSFEDSCRQECTNNSS